MVEAPLVESPAEAAGIRKGDRVLEIGEAAAWRVQQPAKGQQCCSHVPSRMSYGVACQPRRGFAGQPGSVLATGITVQSSCYLDVYTCSGQSATAWCVGTPVLSRHEPTYGSV